MELNLGVQAADQILFEGEGGSYVSWSTAKSPMLSEAKVGGGKLLLRPKGFALPHYADSAKVGYVLRGVCTVGMVEANSAEEKVVVIKNGDVIPAPLGVTSWWYNAGDSECEIVFLGDTSMSLIPGQFTYFFVAGVLSTLGAFSTEFVAKALNLTEKDSDTLTKSQPGVLIVKNDRGIAVPPPNKHLSGKLYKSIDAKLNALTESNFGLLGKVGLSVNYVKLGCGEIFGPVYTTDSSVQLVYVINGSGRIQITGAAGKSEMESDVKEGELFVVPKFYPFAQIAGENGMEVLCVTTSSKPVFGYLSGNKSVWKAFSSGTLQISLGITEEFAKVFKSKV